MAAVARMTMRMSITMQKRTATMKDILMRITMRAGLCIMIPVVALVLFLMLMMSAYTSTFRNLVKMVTCALLLTLIGTQSEIATMVMLQYTFVMFGMRNVRNGMPTMLDEMMVANEGMSAQLLLSVSYWPLPGRPRRRWCQPEWHHPHR